jgi:hypothetical protein
VHLRFKASQNAIARREKVRKRCIVGARVVHCARVPLVATGNRCVCFVAALFLFQELVSHREAQPAIRCRRAAQPAPMLATLVFFGALGGALFGYDLGCMTAALPLMLNDTRLGLTDVEAELIVGHAKWGAAVGALAGVWLLRRGHTLCFWISSLAFIVGPLLLAGATSWITLSAGRLAAGLGIGLSAVASPTYLAEIAPPARRGGSTRRRDPTAGPGEAHVHVRYGPTLTLSDSAMEAGLGWTLCCVSGRPAWRMLARGDRSRGALRSGADHRHARRVAHQHGTPERRRRHPPPSAPPYSRLPIVAADARVTSPPPPNALVHR